MGISYVIENKIMIDYIIENKLSMIEYYDMIVI